MNAPDAAGHRGSFAGDPGLLRKKAGKIEDFVPELVVRYIVGKADANVPVVPPSFDHFSSVAMFADLSGFTVLSEALAVKGGLGAENLGFWLNRYFELLVKLVAKCGGDVFKFAGDALVALWPPEYVEEPRAAKKGLPTKKPSMHSGETTRALGACGCISRV